LQTFAEDVSLIFQLWQFTDFGQLWQSPPVFKGVFPLGLLGLSGKSRFSYPVTWGFLPRFIQYCWIATGMEPAYNPFPLVVSPGVKGGKKVLDLRLGSEGLGKLVFRA
jgi:hypothetical protein